MSGPLMFGWTYMCMDCGEGRSFSFDELWPNQRPDDPYQERPPAPAPCSCGADLTIDAPARCPGCHAPGTDAAFVSELLAD